MFEKSDQALVEQTLDPVLRAAAIIKLSQDRKRFLWMTGLLTLATLFGALVVQQPNASLILLAAIQWLTLFKADSDLRLLRVIDLLQKDGKPFHTQ
ncbi:MAG: hypothetical protein V4675_01455 [Verrucomicrobiota bacterium]